MKEKSLIDRTAEQMLAAGMSWAEGARELRKAMVAALLRKHKGNLCHTARELRIHRNTLTRQLNLLHIADVPRAIRAEFRAQLRAQPALKYGARPIQSSSSMRPSSLPPSQRPRLLDQSRVA
jgi:hypothetical protein